MAPTLLLINVYIFQSMMEPRFEEVTLTKIVFLRHFCFQNQMWKVILDEMKGIFKNLELLFRKHAIGSVLSNY